MRHLDALSLASGLLVGAVAPVARAADAQYMSDISAYNLLAPCVQDALTYNINAQKYSASCGEAQDELQSCICSNTGLLDKVTSSISSDIRSSCGRTGASEDHRSASQMMGQYCNPDVTVEFSTPTTNIVNAYITDLSQMAWLPSCASSALSGAVMQESQSRCPEAASLFAPCVCGKANVVSAVSRTISSSVRYSCSNDEDVSSAYNFYSEYCAMNDGTTSFAMPQGPPGDMSYYITALSEYKEMTKCAQQGISAAIFEQTYSYCGERPQALASCVCLKSGMRSRVSKTVTSSVKGNCAVTATDEVNSALDLLDYYCSAAAGDVEPKVTESVAESYPTAQSGSTGVGGSAPEKTGGSGSGDPGSKDGDNSSDGGSRDGNDDGGDGGGGGGGGVNKTATIAASVLGGVVGLAIIAGAAFFIRRRKKKAAAAAAAAAQTPPVEPPSYLGPPELHGGDSRTELAKPEGLTTQSAWGGAAEMAHEQRTPELQSHSSADRYVPSSNHPVQELPNPDPSNQRLGQWPMQSPQQSHPSVSPMSAGRSEMGWQSGPVESYEMDSTSPRT